MENAIEGFDASYAGDKTGFTVTNSKKVVEFDITHEFVSGTDGKEIPQEVKNLLPADKKANSGDTVSPTDFTTKEVKVEGGKWTFTKWDKDIAVVEGDVKFTGTWTYEEDEPVPPTEYNVVHEFVSGTSGKEIPQEVKNLLPTDKKAKSGETVSPTDFTLKEVKVDGGKWVFTGWNPTSATVENADIKFTGTWIFEAVDEPTPEPNPQPEPPKPTTQPETEDICSRLEEWLHQRTRRS
ncbi:MAG: hypothetical protein GXZ11_05955 [Tissierellia bacterium]|nr:hypothetical protein [Tissierellia bacterium]